MSKNFKSFNKMSSFNFDKTQLITQMTDSYAREINCRMTKVPSQQRVQSINYYSQKVITNHSPSKRAFSASNKRR